MPTGSIVRAFAVMCSFIMLAACGSGTVTHNRGIDPPNSGNPGPGGPGGVLPPPPPPPPVTEVTLTGVVTFDKVPFSTTSGAGLDYAATTQAPARAVALEIVNFNTDVAVANAITDETGAYSVVVPANLVVKVRVKAQMGNVQVLDNTSGDTVYEYEDAQFSTGAIEPRLRDLNVPSGWDGTAYSQPRAAAPFAILDDIYRAQQFVLAAVPGLAFPDLNVFWSPQNTPTVDTGIFDTDRVTGDIDTTQFATVDVNDTDHPGIYVLGSADDDTDEYDSDVIIGSWALYYLASFSRDDSMYGSIELKQDLRAAYSQGWQLAFPLMVKGNAVYQDSSGAAQGDSEDTDFEDNTIAGADAGWFSPFSIGAILYDLWDSNEDAADTIAVPFAALNTVLAQDMPITHAMTSIYPFANGLIARNPGSAVQIAALLNEQNIVMPVDDFGTGETNNGGSVNNLPIYTNIAADDADHDVFSTGDEDNYYNALGNRRYFRFTLLAPRAATNIRARAQGAGAANRDPDIYLWRDGEIVDSATDDSSGAPNNGTQILNRTTELPAGNYVIEVSESGNIFPDDPDTETNNTRIRVRISP